ncbi:flagellar biosynthesis protein FlhA [Devosia sp. J2-20]|jgi:flagellar biosynthesis protein FlhA|uniref:Flagellar biosynthesis protein FlhA n=1 Tax=Devosia litorisediminis TaxID=2829817 RepID=A0A942ECU3_9HYPH|nr:MULTISPECIES: flagellar biosynthesis protein FlhA [Devosia]MBS3847291.1 flagellar biosynthesis protein FlhA [Devosia litorisediminis]MCZ4346663.1 flagellar biosynthesis protein FlhA [Devosia neptuniae]WDQ99575.1 flagellar biosynthesis protein FlhA [Devosia sp. J2-20]|tara:strand:+ start:332 stop:2467 length:2136 start_codon:yes stop_codon:yes gene_type:complete
MTDLPTGPTRAPFKIPSAASIVDMLRSGDIALATGVMGLIVILIVPMPPVLLDGLLAISIVFSVMILMTALFIQKPLEFSSFPTVLLIATMLRLGLNLATTRLILAEGHTGTAAAGHVIEAFGNFVMRGNFVIGVVVFSILVLVNFIVITKGSGRIAEVAARFSLDAMPGKQMAIDADLSAGLIDEDTAKKRRAELEGESAFFGNMDGASKFVRGDAIAGLIITFINVIAGIFIGMMQEGLSVSEAGNVYTLLTIGDGLVSQIPALIVSTAAGILVSKSGVTGSADKALSAQFTGYPRALGMSSAVMGLLAFLPGMPVVPFLLISGTVGYVAWRSARAKDERIADAELEATTKAPALPGGQGQADEQPITDSLKIDELKLELGYGLLSLVKEDENGSDRLTEQIKALRRQLATELGFVMPPVRILDNMQLEPNSYKVRIKEVEAGAGEIFANQLMVMDPYGNQIDLPGHHTTEPTFGLPATWIEPALRDEAELRGLSIIDPSTVISTHLTEVLKTNVADLLSYANVQSLLSGLPKEQQKLVEDIVPSLITVSGVQRVLQTLLNERISIRDLSTILEGVAEIAGNGRSVQTIAEHVRSRLARQLCAANLGPDGNLPLLTLGPQWERDFAEAMVGEGENRHLAMAPSRLQQFIGAVQSAYERAAQVGEIPVLITSPGIRSHVRSIVERFRPQTVVMSQNEVHPRIRLKTVGSV